MAWLIFQSQLILYPSLKTRSITPPPPHSSNQELPAKREERLREGRENGHPGCDSLERGLETIIAMHRSLSGYHDIRVKTIFCCFLFFTAMEAKAEFWSPEAEFKEKRAWYMGPYAGVDSNVTFFQSQLQSEPSPSNLIINKKDKGAGWGRSLLLDYCLLYISYRRSFNFST